MPGTYEAGAHRTWREWASEILLQLIVLSAICSVVAPFEVVIHGG